MSCVTRCGIAPIGPAFRCAACSSGTGLITHVSREHCGNLQPVSFAARQSGDHRSVARPTLSARRDLGRRRREFRGFFRQCREGGAVHLRVQRPPRGAAHRAARAHGRGLALLPAGGAPRTAIRLSRAWPLRPRTRPSLQSEQAADRALRQAHPGRAEAGAMRTSAIASAIRRQTCPSTSATTRPACPSAGDRLRLHVGRRSPAAGTLARRRHLRAARTRFHHATS